MMGPLALECLPSFSNLSKVSRRVSGRRSGERWRGAACRILSPLAAAISDRLLARIPGLTAGWSTAESPSGSEKQEGQGNEVGRIRRDYLHRLGIGAPGAARRLAPQALALAAAAGAKRVQAGAAEASTDFEMSEMDRIRNDELGVSASFQREDFRANFLRKLSYQKVLLPASHRPPKSQTVIIFDWDDTLLCTSFLNGYGPRPLTDSAYRSIRESAKVAKQLLEAASRLGRLFIITNAMEGWVEHSTARWVPELMPTLKNVNIISARTRFEPHFPGEVYQWKAQAFLEVQRQLYTEVVTNVLSVGDSDYEMEAAHIMGKQFSKAMIKTIKLQHQPTPEDLHKELVLVWGKFERIVENARPLKVCMERKVGSPPVRRR